ncbi:MAG: alpha-ketoacid dehydrogenase subunit beta [Cellvibrionales bacterium]|nr:alpha-ketoacid dehydrogenase subunit beta [Porticoccaceae bacterium]|tara:strand:- start:33621 stop:34628 length:1008 start_codon:yes stop_codon:yes gene_type:complete
MSIKTIREVIGETLSAEMRRDSDVLLMGEDVAGGAGCSGEDDAFGGAFGFYKGMVGEFGRGRVIDTPISESAFIGAAGGAAATGMRPVVDLMFVDFVGVCFDQIFNQMAKFRYMFGGKSDTPVVILAMVGAGLRAGAQHSQMLHPMLTAIPGLKVVMPSNAYDTKGLLTTAIRDNDPVVFLQHKLLFESSCEVPDEDYEIPFGQAAFTRQGNDVTIVALSSMVHKANAVADKLATQGIAADVIDPRTTSPLDEEAILESVEMSGRLVIVDEANERCSMAADISSLVADRGFSSLRAGIKKVTAPHTPVPFAPLLEDLYIPDEADIEAAVMSVLKP